MLKAGATDLLKGNSACMSSMYAEESASCVTRRHEVSDTSIIYAVFIEEFVKIKYN